MTDRSALLTMIAVEAAPNTAAFIIAKVDKNGQVKMWAEGSLQEVCLIEKGISTFVTKTMNGELQNATRG